MSIHREMMGMARQTLHETMERLVTYTPVSGVPIADVSVRWTSAADMFIETDSGLQNLRSIIVSAQIGTEPGRVASIERGGIFSLDVDGTGDEPWTVESILGVDGEGGSGFIRVQCTRPLLRNGVAGTRRARQ